MEPWLGALEELLSNRATYERVAVASRDAALSYVAGLGVAPFEDYLENLTPKCPPSTLAQRQPEPQDQTACSFAEIRNSLSPERLELLALLLRSSSGKVD